MITSDVYKDDDFVSEMPKKEEIDARNRDQTGPKTTNLPKAPTSSANA